MLRYFEKRLQTVYNILFVLMEDQPIEWKPDMMYWTILWNLLDYFQIIRAAIHPEFGWNSSSGNLVEKFDLFYWITYLGSKVVPQWSFYILSLVIFATALGDAIYAFRLFREGNVQKLWPITILRYSRKFVLSIFFISLMKWLIMPLECEVREDYNMSEDIHGEGHGCTIFQVPDIIASVTSIVLAPLVVLFAYWSHYFCFSVNVLSRTTEAGTTGRIEVHFLLLKVFSIFLPYVVQYITGTAVTVILTLFAAILAYRHFQTLPFHHQPTNLLRGGIYTSIAWIFLCGILTSVMDNGTLQWVFLAITPVTFLLGMFLTHHSHTKYCKDLDRLRGEWEDLQAAALEHTEHGPASSEDGGVSRSSAKVSVRKQQPSKPRTAKQKGFEYFFDPAFERKRAFQSGRHALACTRTLLYQKDKEDIPFMQSISERGLSEFPRFQEFHMFNLILKIFVFNQPLEVAAEQKRLKSNQDTLPLDLRFTLYSIERQGIDASEANELGKDGAMTAKNLMEYRIGVKQAKEAHMQCLQAMKGFWTHAAKADSKTQIGDMVKYLERFQRAEINASKAYGTLRYKYPTSVELLYAWASYADSVLNDPVEADDTRKKARDLQDDEEEIDEDVQQMDAIDEMEKSSGSGGTSTSENRRTKLSRESRSWRHQIMQTQELQLGSMRRRIQVLLCVILCVAASAFVVSDFILFKTLAKQEMEMITIVGDMRTSVASTTYYIREMILAVWIEDEEKFHHVQKAGHDLAAHIAYENFFIRDHVHAGEAKEYFNHKKFLTSIPYAGPWRVENMTLWELGNDFARRADLGFTSTWDELHDNDFVIANISDHKRGISYVYENFFRSLAPAYEGLEELYVHEMELIKSTTDLLVAATSCANAVLLITMAIFLYRGMASLVSQLEYKSTVVYLALSLPRPTKKKLCKFYGAHEKRMQAMEDEDLDKEEMVANDEKHEDHDGEDTTIHGEDGINITRSKSDASNGSSHSGGPFSKNNRDNSKDQKERNVLRSQLEFDDKQNHQHEDQNGSKAHTQFSGSVELRGSAAPPRESRSKALDKHEHVVEMHSSDTNGASNGNGAHQEHERPIAFQTDDKRPSKREPPLLREGSQREGFHDGNGSENKASVFGSSIFNLPWARDSKPAPRVRRRSTDMIGDFSIKDARMDPVVVRTLDSMMKSRRAWYNRKSVYGGAVAVLLLLGVMSTSFPARNLPDLITLAPIVNQAGRRVELFRALINYAREIIMDDGLSRHTHQELSNTMKYLIDELRVTDQAIRLGHAKGIDVGADDRNKYHNDVMYTPYCPWRDDSHNCPVDEKPSAANRGLLFLFNSFLDAAESVLAIYGDPPKGDLHAFEHIREEGHDAHGEFDTLHIDDEHYGNLTGNADIQFMTASFTGELYEGLHYIEVLFNHEMEALLEKGVEENDMLFSFFVVSLVIGFYGLTFRRTMSWGNDQVQLARQSVMQIPMFILSESERAVVKEHFITPEEHLDDDADFISKSPSSG